MGHLLDDLLELSRIGRVIHTPRPLALGELVREAAALAAGALEAAGAELVIGDNLPTVVGDEPRLLEVFQNLIENAARFMGDEPSPSIEIGARQEDEHVLCWVRDNGIGVAPRYHDKIFGLFERLSPSAPGTGIGLALVKRIVEFHGGRIWVESEGLGRGSTFFFTLTR